MHLSASRLEELCYSDLNTTEAERGAVVQSLLKALSQLESTVDMGSPVRKVVEGGGADWMGQYMVKREYSEGSIHVSGIVVPDLRETNGSTHQPHNLTKCSDGIDPNDKTNHDSKEECGVASGEADAAVNACQGCDCRNAAAHGRSTAEAVNEATDSDQTAAGDGAELANREAASGTCTCVVEDWLVASRAVAIMHKAQAFLRPLVPQSISQVRPVAMLLGRSNSSINGSIQQPGYCANVDSQTQPGDRTDESKAKPAEGLMHPSKVLESMAEARSRVTGPTQDAESRPISVPHVLPEPKQETLS